MTTARFKLSPLSRKQAAMAFALALVIAATAVVGSSLVDVAHAHPPEAGPSVRVAALKSEDGRVIVGVQALGADGQWGEILLPTRRVISASSRTNAWLRSSPVTIDGGDGSEPLFCVIAHGAAHDHFWVKFRAFLYQSADQSATGLRFETHLRGEDQAAAIDRCVADGAAVIASTLASPDDVREPLIEAKAAGTQIITFNAGVEHARGVGSEIHIALNDRAAGELAGQQFNERGISGQIACLIHERDNLSLEHRCDGLEASYRGAGVVRVQLEEVDAQIEHDRDGLIDNLAAALGDGQGTGYDAVLALNADTLGHVLSTVQQMNGTGDAALIASVGFDVNDLAEFPADWLDRRLGPLISDSADAQGFFVGSALQLSHNLHNAHVIGQPQLWLAVPSLLDHQTNGDHAETLEALSNSLDRILEQHSGTRGPAAGVNVRVAAHKRDDGSIVFAIESMGPDRRWSSRQLPRLRVLAADAPSGVRSVSSAVALSSDAERAPLFCVVTHGSKQDRYWQVARAYMHVSAHVTNTNWRYEAHLNGADQAAAIDRCSADGAVVIASTLADPEAVTDSLLAAKQAGARIVTFNSGSAYAAAAGSEIHVALDDREAGAAAGRVINEHNINGPIVCVFHETGNVGLEERCEGLEATYQGASVSRLQLTEGATDEQVIEELVGALTDPSRPAIELALTLNANTLFGALDAVSLIYAESGRTIQVVPIGTHIDLIRRSTPETRARHRLAGFNDSVESQGFLVVSAMHFVHQHPT
ncbi:MAG: substrate-binding domain-containing protein, partial [Chloroflexi bacterium]|nr:substrate-binding domain-containing protein [Chloroflexota bacterium]